MLSISMALSSYVPDLQSDSVLLGRYVRDRNGESFAALVQRHGPLVFGVCRRVIPDQHLAEDAFQAVFLVLARKADAVKPADALPQWLYGVAYRVSLRARAMAAKRSAREQTPAAFPERMHWDRDADDLQDILDDAISQLPQGLKDAVVLCELNGMSRKDAAKRLAIAEGTLSSRLAAARKKLAVILQSRGVTLPAGTLAVSMLVPPSLVQATVDSMLNPHVATHAIQTLVNTGAGMLYLQKLKLGLSACVGMGLLAGGLSIAWANPATIAEPLAVPVMVKYEPIRKDAVWDRFKLICGSDESSKKLFDEMMGDEKTAKMIRAAESSDEKAFEFYSTRTKELGAAWKDAMKDFYGQPSTDESRMNMRVQSLKVISQQDILQHLFLGAKSIPQNTKDISENLVHQPALIDLLSGSEQSAGRKLFLAWLERRTNTDSLQMGLSGSLFVNMPEILPLARKRIAEPKLDVKTRSILLKILGNRGDKSDLPTIEKYLDNREVFSSATYTNGTTATGQIRDLAAVMYLKLHGEDPEKHGFDVVETIAWWVGKDPAPYTDVSIFDAEIKRDQALFNFNFWRVSKSRVKKKIG